MVLTPEAPPAVRRPHPCPHCGSKRTEGHGSFPRKDGTRQPRRLCRNCGRTFNQYTNTPLHYIKKRAQWVKMTRRMARPLPLRRMASFLGVAVSTAFRWRHGLFAALPTQAEPPLTGQVTAGEAYVPFSTKGSRKPPAPGVRTGRYASTSRRFRRLIDGRPSCVLLATSGDQKQAVTIVGQGRPWPGDLHTALTRVLGPHAELQADGLAPYAEACRRAALPCQTGGIVATALWGVRRLRSRLYSWLATFRGVATRYLPHYVTWFSLSICSTQPNLVAVLAKRCTAGLDRLHPPHNSCEQTRWLAEKHCTGSGQEGLQSPSDAGKYPLAIGYRQ